MFLLQDGGQRERAPSAAAPDCAAGSGVAASRGHSGVLHVFIEPGGRRGRCGSGAGFFSTSVSWSGCPYGARLKIMQVRAESTGRMSTSKDFVVVGLLGSGKEARRRAEKAAVTGDNVSKGSWAARNRSMVTS